MEILKAFLMVVLLIATGGCVTSDKGQDLNHKICGIDVGTPDGFYKGIMEIVPTNLWYKIEMNNAGIIIEVPDRTANKNMYSLADLPNDGSILMYPIRSHYPDAKYGAQVSIQRVTISEYKENIERLKRIMSEPDTEWAKDPKRRAEVEWRSITDHAVLDVYNENLYRKNVRCPNGDILLIEGKVVKGLVETQSGKMLFPEMDAVVRRIINSIQPRSKGVRP